jgi:GNAT superfamily N-acetyltransferase
VSLPRSCSDDDVGRDVLLRHAVHVPNRLDGPRLSDIDDLPALREIVDTAYARYLERMDRPPAPMTDDLRSRIEASEVWVLGRPVSALICLLVTGDALLVENIAVHPDAQGAGLGRRLMNFAEDEARRLDIDRLQLYANEVMTENLSIYGHLGFLETGRRIEGGFRRIFMERTVPPRASNGDGSPLNQ